MYKVSGVVDINGIRLKLSFVEAVEKPKTYDLGYESVGVTSNIKKTKLGDNFSIFLEKLEMYKYITIFDSRKTTQEEALEFVKQKLTDWQTKAIEQMQKYLDNKDSVEVTYLMGGSN